MLLAVSILTLALQQAAPVPSPAASPATTTTTATTAMPRQRPVPSIGDIISALDRSRAATAQLRSLTGLTTNDITLVKVDTTSPDAAPALTTAEARDRAQVAAMRNVLATMKVTAATDNTPMTVAQFLADNRIDLSRVIATDVSGSKVVIFIAP